MRFESQLSRRNCQTFSTGLSSGHFGGSGMMVMFAGTTRLGRYSFGDFRQVQVHGLGVAGRQDQGGALALVWADRAEVVGGSGALVTRRDGTGTALGPPSRDLVLLANASFVGEPDFYCLVVERFFSRDCLQTRGETFLKFSIAPSALGGQGGRAGDVR